MNRFTAQSPVIAAFAEASLDKKSFILNFSLSLNSVEPASQVLVESPAIPRVDQL